MAPSRQTSRRRRIATWLMVGAVALAGLVALIGQALAPPPASPEEQARWDEALTQLSGHGLREYLRRHPDGAYADEAEARLDACVVQSMQYLGPKRDEVLPLVVPAADPFPTEAAARDDALDRGRHDALVACRPLRRTAELLSVSPGPEIWHCAAVEGGHTCGFEGDLRCRVRDHALREVERCPDAAP